MKVAQLVKNFPAFYGSQKSIHSLLYSKGLIYPILSQLNSVRTLIPYLYNFTLALQFCHLQLLSLTILNENVHHAVFLLHFPVALKFSFIHI